MNPRARFRSAVDQLGFTILPNAVLLTARLTPREKIVYAALRHYARQDAACFPGQATLAQLAGVSERQLRDDLKRLQAAGLITIEQRGQNKTNLYWLEPLHDGLLLGRLGLAPDRKPGSDPDRNPGSDDFHAG